MRFSFLSTVFIPLTFVVKCEMNFTGALFMYLEIIKECNIRNYNRTTVDIKTKQIESLKQEICKNFETCYRFQKIIISHRHPTIILFCAFQNLN